MTIQIWGTIATYTDIVIFYPIARIFTTDYHKNRSIWNSEIVKELIVSLLEFAVILQCMCAAKQHTRI